MKIKWLFICIFSFTFYGWWDVRYLPLFVATALVDFYAALAIHRYDSFKKLFLFVSLGINLLILFSFKYIVFFNDSVEWLASQVGFDVTIQQPSEFFLVVPIGLSFYTFQSMSYTIDVYKGRIEPTREVFHFLASLSFFPHLVAGPIVRAADFLPQLLRFRKPTDAEKWNATRLIVSGYFKKVVLADNLAPMVNAAFQNHAHVNDSVYWWIVMVCFSFQIYFDFSGYSDIARGLAKFFGFHFRLNFNYPYLSTSFRMFWRRWHISLSSWFRDYVFIPLGGSRRGKLRTHLNIWITMLLSGLWHGAGVTFIVWGALHAFYQSAESLLRFKMTSFHSQLMCGTLVFLLTTIAWVFFRAGSFDQAMMVITKMCSFNSEGFPLSDYFIVGCGALSIGILLEVMQGFLKHHVVRQSNIYLEAVRLAVMINVCIFFRGNAEQFIYFQF